MIKTRYFARTNEVDVWHCYHQQWTGRISASLAWGDKNLLASLNGTERLRIARMAARRGNRDAAAWWAAHATNSADRAEARRAVTGWQG